jgi:polyisoprenoid-binding protein YceI
MKTGLTLSARLGHGGAVLAAALAVASPALATDTYTFDKAHTTVGFQVRHIFTMVGGKFQDFTGTIQIDRANPESSSVEFTIQAASIFTGDPKRDEHLRSPDFFDVATHPTLTFKSTSIKASGKDSWLVTGDLTMRGVTKSITLPVALLGEGKDPWGNEKAGFETSITLSRKDYGMNWNKTLDQGGVLVDDAVKVQISIEANKAKPPAASK